MRHHIVLAPEPRPQRQHEPLRQRFALDLADTQKVRPLTVEHGRDDLDDGLHLLVEGFLRPAFLGREFEIGGDVGDGRVEDVLEVPEGGANGVHGNAPARCRAGLLAGKTGPY